MSAAVTGQLQWLNSLPLAEAIERLKSCCGCERWARVIAGRRPFDSIEQLLSAADDVWWSLSADDWLEAFKSHPRIGEKKAEAFSSKQSADWSRDEQAGAGKISGDTAKTLASLNADYVNRFGYIFIVCATGKSAEEMLAILRKRLQNDADEEIRVAATEQVKITALRLRKLLH